MSDFLLFMQQGLWPFGPWWAFLGFLLMVQLTIFAVTLYLHRCQAHRALDLHPVVSHFFRFWLWLTTGMVTREWVAIHRKHHAKCETAEDPHSPLVYGIGKVLFHGVELYTREGKNLETIAKYSHGTPDDWIERNLYNRFKYLGIALLLFINVALFGAIGITFYAIQIVWIPFWAAGVINGAGHWWGYRNFSTDDTSTNLSPWGLWIGGEELHNNHHAFPSSARFSMKKWEFDAGWGMIRLLRFFGLAKVLREAPQLMIDEDAHEIDKEALMAVFTHRFSVLKNYYREVVVPVCRQEAEHCQSSMKGMLKKAGKFINTDEKLMDGQYREKLLKALEQAPSLKQVYEFRKRLDEIWSRRTTQPEQLLQQLRQWCADAEASGIESLQNFASTLKAYRLQMA